MEKSDVVIIGGVAAGPKTGATLARRNPDLKITLFQREDRISYGTCGLPYFASGDISSFDELMVTSYGTHRDPGFFQKTKGFEVRIHSEVIKIDRAEKTITVKNLATGDESVHGYDKLVIATGAVPADPPFSVPDSGRVRPFTRPDDAIHFRKMAETGQVGKVAIVGAGFIGCEMAEATARTRLSIRGRERPPRRPASWPVLWLGCWPWVRRRWPPPCPSLFFCAPR